MIEITRIDVDLWKSAHITFRDDGPVKVGAKTRQFSVFSTHNRALLGYVKWWVHWRQYVFFPLNSIFDKNCLREIAEFCEQSTKVHKDRLSTRKNYELEKKKRWRVRRMEDLAKNKLTNQKINDTVDSVITQEVVQPENGLVEGSQTLTPLEVELGTISFGD